MPFITWDAKYSVKVKQIDTQHKMLFQMLNRLHEAMASGQGKNVLAGILDELVGYTHTHFSAEENLLRANGYPRLENHQTEHRLLMESVYKFKREFDAGRVALSIDLMEFLRAWLQKHIGGTDHEYAHFLNSKGVA